MIMTFLQRIKSPTASFFKKIRNAGLALAGISAAILTAPVAMPPIIVTVAGYLGVAGAVASTVSQATSSGRKNVGKKRKRNGR